MKRLIAIFTVFFMFAQGLMAQTVIKGNVSTATGKDIVNSAMQYIGTPYRSGRMSPTSGFDCSGFTSFIYKMQDISLPRSSRSQYMEETAIDDCRNLKKGDLVFFSGSRVSKRIGHVGIVTKVNKKTGEFSFIHSSCSEGVTISHSTETYYAKRYIGACRVLSEKQTEEALKPYWKNMFGFEE